MTKIESIDAYPLQWPVAWHRNEKPQRSRFGTRHERGWGTKPITVASGRDFLLEELRRLGVNTSNSVVVSTNVPVRKDGLPYSNAREPADSGVAIYFIKDGEQMCFPCDTYDRVADNLYAVGKVIEALRAIDRHGSNIMNAAFSGFKALPETGTGTKWWVILEVDRDDPWNEIKTAYKKQIKLHHPDRNNGNDTQFQLIQFAFNQAKQARGEQ